MRTLHVSFAFFILWTLIVASNQEQVSSSSTRGLLAMEMIRSALARIRGLFGQREQEPPKYTFPDTLEGFGYHFNENGELRNKDGGGFQFVVREDDRDYNQQHYDALGEIVTEYLYSMMEKELNLEKVYVPVDASKEEAQSFIFRSRDAQDKDKLMVLIHGSGAVRAGQWSRKLIINENIDTGSQFPYIRHALEDGYGVIVMNPNLNEVTVNGKSVPIRGSESPEDHGIYVWNKFVLQAKARNIVIVAHSYGGIVTFNIAAKFLEDFQKRVFCVVFTDSVHTADRARWSQPAKDFMKERAVNFASAYVPLDVQLDVTYPDDCPIVSAGTKEHERTSHSCIDSAFRFIRENYDSWSKDGSMAPRNFLPLPDNLEDYSPAARWKKKQEEAERELAEKKRIEGAKEAEKDQEEAKEDGKEEKDKEPRKAKEAAEDEEKKDEDPKKPKENTEIPKSEL